METMQGGDLYQLQQEAIHRARETAKKAAPKVVSENKSILPFFESDSMVIIVILALLLLNGCNDMLLILALALILIL